MSNDEKDNERPAGPTLTSITITDEAGPGYTFELSDGESFVVNNVMVVASAKAATTESRVEEIEKDYAIIRRSTDAQLIALAENPDQALLAEIGIVTREERHVSGWAAAELQKRNDAASAELERRKEVENARRWKIATFGGWGVAMLAVIVAALLA